MKTDTDNTTVSDRSTPTRLALSPTPWRQGARGPNGCPIIGDNKGVMVCMLAHSDNEADQCDTAEANAQLIAAAPQMLKALQFYAEHMRLGYEITDSGQVAEEAILEALRQNN